MIKRIVLGFVVCAFTACPKPIPTPPSPTPIDGPATCGTACERLRIMRCPGGEPTPAGATCETVCGNMQTSGIVAWDLTCVTMAANCTAADNCD